MHVVLGAGATGTATAQLLASKGKDVRILTRSGSGPASLNIELVKGDAADPATLERLTKGAEALYNCANPLYHQWATQWPPLAESILNAAASNDVTLVTLSNLYGYAPSPDPLKETEPLNPPSKKGAIRTAMWNEARAAHEQGRVRAVEARASDFIGPGLGKTSHMGDRVIKPLLAGKAVSTLGNLDVPHTWTAISDVARTLVALGEDESAWGRAWHVPSVEPLSQRALVHRLCVEAGVDPVKIRTMPSWAVTAIGLFNPVVRELKEVLYQFEQPFVMDSSATVEHLSLPPTPLDQTLEAVVASYGTTS